MSSFHFALLRHGVTAWNAERRIQGQSDIPLLPKTVDEYRSLQLPQKWCAVPWRVSPLIRTIQTADALAIDGFSPDEHWIEMNWGDWEGKKLSDLRRDLGAQMQENEDRGWDFRPDGGESPRDVLSRVEAALASNRDGNFGVVTHKGIIRAVYAAACGWNMMGKSPDKLDWKAVHVFSWSSDDGLGIVDLNCPLLERDGTTT
ncbi:phosphoglycerate mutase [Thalassospira lucentensis]|uniref:Phosphoglycerate mutase n=1 Tax=Thalassospira lucentensis TaxID=168935 RepID=A0A154LAK6_9PROT|nr:MULTISPECIES: histidine phosphatase family protein [Thalassospira]KZB68239.1 phosphoglycerate mutase [Thalassospira lucentensis]MCH2274396.1 histidine phosphatase family protein [Thalassospira sp.]